MMMRKTVHASGWQVAPGECGFMAFCALPGNRRHAAAEVAAAVHALNRMPGLGRPSCARVA